MYSVQEITKTGHSQIQYIYKTAHGAQERFTMILYLGLHSFVSQGVGTQQYSKEYQIPQLAWDLQIKAMVTLMALRYSKSFQI